MAKDSQESKNIGSNNFNWKKLIVTILLITSIGILAWWYFFGFGNEEYEYISYDKFLGLLKKDDNPKTGFIEIKTDISKHQITSIYKDVNGISRKYAVLINQSTFAEELRTFTPGSLGYYIKNGYEVDWFGSRGNKLIADVGPLKESRGSQLFYSIIASFIPILLLGGLLFFIFKRSGRAGDSGLMSFGKSPAKKIVSKKTFLDIAGQEELKEEVREVIDFLKRPEKYKAAGAKIPKGILLGGPPGTGKTLTAKAVAGEANVPFFFISASNFVEMFAGMGAKRVREMFKEARKNAPSILFIDEMDAVGRKRGTSLSGNDEREQTLNQILVELDGMIESNGLLVMAATNRPDVLDPALLRPGRFDRTITIGYPDIKERELILRLHAKGKRLSNKIDFKNIAKRTPRYSGADLESVINEATLLSVRENSPIINIEHVDEAIDRVMAGPSKKHRIITPEENKLVAIHEAGHAVIGLKNKDADIVQKITIIPRGEAGGYTLSTPKKEQYNYRKSQFEAKIMGLLGGRAAEQVYYGKGEVTTGAYDDIQKATSLARSMVTQFGMSILGPIAYEKPQGSKYLGYDSVQKDYSDSLAERIDEAVRELIEKAEKKAIEVIEKNKKLLDLIVEELLEKETIVVEEINYINKNLKRPPKKRKIKKINKDKSLNEIIKELKIEKNNKKISKIKKVDKNKSLNKIIKEVKDEKNNKKISKNKKTK